eukprot:Lithocolla_globosa_v1_NODE_1685_length_2400_cov_184.983369.p2 type:complete len:134 gc:universal NODE_1685_length_2400_cov_184.983369:1085-1486(+)
MVVFLLMMALNTPPCVSIPSDRGVTSSNTRSLTSPDNTPPWMAAPMATASSGLTLLDASFLNKSWIMVETFGILVIPPTRMTSSMSVTLIPASLMAFLQGLMVRSISFWVRDSNLERLSLTFRCLGPVLSAVM